MTKGRVRRVVKGRVPEEQAPFFTLPGRAGFDNVSVLWNSGSSATVTGRDVLDRLAAARNVSVIPDLLT